MKSIPTGSETLSILLADDDEDDREMFKNAVAQISSRFRMIMVGSGQAALDVLSTLSSVELPCLIVLDINMIDLDGMQTLEALQKDSKYDQIPKIIFSTTLSNENRLKFISLGATAVIIKPARMAEMILCIKKMLAYCFEAI
jgi:CheY-like chemotaxis protein